MSEKIEFPKWKYHASEEARIVKSAEAEAALGAGWVDSPAEVEASDPRLTRVEKALHDAEDEIQQLKRPAKKAK